MAPRSAFVFDNYLELVDATGRVIREDKKGYIPGETSRILERLNIILIGQSHRWRPALPPAMLQSIIEAGGSLAHGV